MIELNLEQLLSEISPDSPCGENLEEEATFLKLEDEAKFVEERQMGDSTIPAKEPDWKIVRSLSLELLESTRNIQIAMHLTCSLLRLDGFNGLNQGLTLLKGWLEKYWDFVYPLKDSEDDYPVLRINTLSSLNDYTLIRCAINHIPLTQSGLGNFSWRDIELAEGKISPKEDEKQLEMSVIEAAFNDTNLETLQNLLKPIKQSFEQIKGVSEVVIEKADAVNAPDLSAVTNLLQSINKFVTERVQQRQALEGIGEESVTEGAEGEVPVAKQVGKKVGIHSRDDVIRSIDEMCKYFERYEPSSPVPFLLQRAKKLLTMNFMDILRDMTPDGVNQAENICGVKDDQDS